MAATSALNMKNRKMDELTNSDSNLTMLATKSFDHILELVQTSRLNSHIQISPFSAFISLKKSLIRDQSGKPFLPTKLRNISTENVEALIVKNRELEKTVHPFKRAHRTDQQER